MKRHLKVKGDIVKREREKRAWTQEELSERSQLGVRTLRRIEAGQGSLESIRRVTEALNLPPEATLAVEMPNDGMQQYRGLLQLDSVCMEFSPTLIPEVNRLIERVGSVRRHLVAELGFLAPGVRFRDNLKLPAGQYRILVRELPAGRGLVHLDQVLAVGDGLRCLDGEVTTDPTYGLPAVWIRPETAERATEAGCMVFDAVSVIATHLTYVLRNNAWRLLGIEEVHQLLEWLPHKRLVAEVVPARVSVVTLRAVLRDLLREGVPIRDLPLILETLADHATLEERVEDLVEAVREALGELLCQEFADAKKVIQAVVLSPELERKLENDWQPELLSGLEGHVLVTSSALRRRVRETLAPQAVLARREIRPGYRVEEGVRSGLAGE